MRTLIALSLLALCACQNSSTPTSPAPATESVGEAFSLQTLEGEKWWFGVTAQGEMMPLAEGYEADVREFLYGNQVQPLLISTKGRGIWCDQGFNFRYAGGELLINGAGAKVETFTAGETLKSAYLHAARTYFPPTGELPDELLFAEPQYNTWIELQYDQNQADILRYAHAIIDNGLPPGVLMIDDNWQENYGKWDFHPGRFPDPKAMMEELHGLGFKVMLWVCPFVSPDSDVFRAQTAEGIFLMDADTTKKHRGHRLPEMVSWWNGVSAVLDLSNPKAKRWFQDQLDYLQEEYSVDGYKLDAGDAEFYVSGEPHVPGTTANEQSMLFAEVGLKYPLNEYRACFKMGGQPLVQRLRDKSHSWADLQKLVPQMITSGLAGYYFSCPDMIGGGEFTSFAPGADLDEELIIRSAQVHALMPMMQFSVAPWRILDAEGFAAVKAAVALRTKFQGLILETARASAESGEPILRALEYNYPNQGLAEVTDQFMIGETLLVAPVVTSGTSNRKVVLPAGSWRGYDGKAYRGGQTVEVAAAVDVLPYFTREN